MGDSAIFLSDVHLRDSTGVKAQLVMRFLRERASNYRDIYILGDLFDVWPGTTDFLLQTFQPIIKILGELVEQGHNVTYVEGNHDFLLGDAFSKDLGIRVFPNEAEVAIGDRRVYLAHGDLGNPKDIPYRLLRSLLRSRFTQTAVHLVPSEWVFKVGNRSAQLSRDYQRRGAHSGSHIRQVYRKTAESLFDEGYDVVLMGHTHLPDDVSTVVKGRRCRYINLGDWVSHFTYLEFDGSDFYTKTHPLTNHL